MKLHYLLMISHMAAGVVAALTVGVVSLLGGGLLLTLILAGIAIVLGALAGGYVASKIVVAIRSLDHALANSDGAHVQFIGLKETDQLGERMVSIIRRWAEAANSSREQTREIERLIHRLSQSSGNGLGTAGRASGAELRYQLGSISHAAAAGLNQILACTKEIERHTREISLGTQEQSDAVSKTTTYVEQMSANIDTVARNAGAAKRAAVTTRDAASAALQLVRDLVGGMNRIRTHVEASESRLRSLGDHSQEIGSIVEMIGAISSRTDMLALNASIESVRAGEHGRGFAVVAEEVRKLAEQAAQATREASGLIESIQLETQESVALMAEEREEVEAEVSRVNAAGEALERISQISTDSATQVAEITQATQLQLQLTQDVVLAVERISEVARASRSRADEAIWTTNTLTTLAQQFDVSLKPLRDCSRDDAPQREVANEGNVRGFVSEPQEPLGSVMTAGPAV